MDLLSLVGVEIWRDIGFFMFFSFCNAMRITLFDVQEATNSVLVDTLVNKMCFEELGCWDISR